MERAGPTARAPTRARWEPRTGRAWRSRDQPARQVERPAYDAYARIRHGSSTRSLTNSTQIGPPDIQNRSKAGEPGHRESGNWTESNTNRGRPHSRDQFQYPASRSPRNPREGERSEITAAPSLAEAPAITSQGDASCVFRAVDSFSPHSPRRLPARCRVPWFSVNLRIYRAFSRQRSAP